jgi:hypothetical protein
VELALAPTVVARHVRNLRDTSLVRRRRAFYALGGAPARRLVEQVTRYASG